MVSWLRKFTLLLLSAILLMGLCLPDADAAEAVITIEETYINPLYADVITEEDLLAHSPSHRVLYANPSYLTSVEEAGLLLREGMKNRSETVSICLKTDSYDGNQDSIKALMRSISDYALLHTGDPKEGDYLMWQYGGWSGKANGEIIENAYYWTFTYQFVYYTTAAQEAEMDEAVASLLDTLDLNDKTDYQKIHSIYGFICKHVDYDNDHLSDSSYKRQFTAYAALMDGTAVCQGYSLLFYRLALESDVDARLIPGRSNGQNHGWNIVELHDRYYNCDTTWDEGKTEYSHFLKCQANFSGHTRDAEYDNADFHNAYPMGTADYVPTPDDLCTHSYSSAVTTDPTCTTAGIRTVSCTLCGNAYSETIEALGHNYELKTTNATCTDDGYTQYTCKVCGDSYRESIPATGHDWDEGTIILEPTAAEDGILEKRCTACPATKTTSIPFNSVYRISGKDRYKTAFLAADMLKKQLRIEDFDCAVIASGTNFADALSGSYLACVNNAPILLVNASTIPDVVTYLEENLASNGRVYILGGTAAVPAELDGKLSAYQVERLSGRTRYDTNLKILDAAGVTEEDILVCTGVSFADSLSASALNRPILLVNQTLTDAQKAFLSKLDRNNIYIIGGTGAVSETVAQALTSYGSGNVRRISGKNRYVTSIRVAETFFPDDPDSLVLAYGHNFPDGLCGGVLANSMHAPLILTRDSDKDLAAEYAYDLGITTGAVLGGTKLISDEAVRTIYQMDTTDPILKP